MKLDLVTHLRELDAVCSITGRERAMAELLQHTWAPVVDESTIDRLGSYIGLKRGMGSKASLQALPYPGPEGGLGRYADRPPGPPKVMVSAHTDTIGALVTAIEPGGFLRVTQVGGMDRRLLVAQEVEIYGVRVVPGVVGSRPPHLTTEKERTKLLPLESLFIDTGLSESEVRERIRIGDPVQVRSGFWELANGRLSCRYMDDRASLVALRVALEELQGIEHTADFYAVGTVGEEASGLSGAMTTAFAIKPDIGIAIDVTFGKHPGCEEETFALGVGPVLGVGPNCTPKLLKLIRTVAAESGISYDLESVPGNSHTDAWGIHVARGGVASGVISIPLRYMHAPVETVDLEDIRAVGRLVARLVARIDEEVVRDLTCY